MKVLFHLDSEASWGMVLENVRNMLKFGEENQEQFTIEIVVNGIAAVGLLLPVAEKTRRFQEMEELVRKKVVFAVCANALGKYNPGKAPLCPFAQIVPSGVVEIARRQNEGFAYIKP